jgi:hypothetical protein
VLLDDRPRHLGARDGVQAERGQPEPVRHRRDRVLLDHVGLDVECRVKVGHAALAVVGVRLSPLSLAEVERQQRLGSVQRLDPVLASP